MEPIHSLEAAIAALNAEIERRQQAEILVAALTAENAILRGQLCQCRQDPEMPTD